MPPLRFPARPLARPIRPFRAAAAFLCLLIGNAGAVNLLLNPSFEDPVVSQTGNHVGTNATDWTTVGGSPNVVYPNPGYNGGNAPQTAFDGNNYFDISGVGYLQQAVDLTGLTGPTTFYFGAWFSPREPGFASGLYDVGVELWNQTGTTLIASVNGNVQNLLPANSPSGDYEWGLVESHYTFSADQTILFRITLDGNATNVDLAHIDNVPEPARALLALVGLMAVLSRHRRRSVR